MGLGFFKKQKYPEMKRVILSTLVSIFVTNIASAQLSGDGFYRIQNNASQRYITINDDIVGEINMSSTTADLSNIVTWRGFDYVKSNPASIIYVEAVGSKYNLAGQGTSVYKITGGRAYLDLPARDGGLNLIQTTYSGATVRLYDNTKSADKGYVMQKNSNADYMYWKFLPINTSDNYLGLQPTVQTSDGYYGTVYSSYSFKKVSDGIKIYYIDNVQQGACRLQEITTEIIPGNTPIIFKCSSNDPAQNMIMPVIDAGTGVSGNLLGGTLFASITNKHEKYVEYNASTMRVLGVNSNNQLVFTTATAEQLANDGKHIPMNTCWLNVSESITGDLLAVDEATYSGIRTINTDATDSNAKQGTYSLSGIRVDDSKPLKAGIYIQNGKKMVVK